MGSPDVFVAVLLAVICGAAFIAVLGADRRRAGLRARLAAISTSGSAPLEDPEQSLTLRRQEVGRRSTFLPWAIEARLADALAATGNRIRVWHVVAAAAISAVAAGLFCVLVMGLSPPVVIAVAIGAGIGVPAWLVRRGQQRFQRQFLDAFPDALDLIVRGVRAGLPVLSAMGVAAEEIPGPVGNEMQYVLDQMRIGVDMEDALQQAARRVRVADFWFFVVGLTLQRRTGGALAETLANLSTMIRRRKEIRVKARALTAESRTSTIILAALPIAVAALLFIVSGESMRAVLADPRGRFLIGIAVVLLLAGIGTMVTLVGRALR